MREEGDGEGGSDIADIGNEGGHMLPVLLWFSMRMKIMSILYYFI